MVRLIWIATLSMVFSGCSSIRTQMWTRAEDEHLHPDHCHGLKGMPVMLKVPSHLEVTITETLYAAHRNTKDGFLEVVDLGRPDLNVSANLKYTEKMFLVDPVRVGAGEGGYGFGFGSVKDGAQFKNANEEAQSAGHGYLSSMNYKADDQTIRTSATLLARVLSLERNPARATTASLTDGKFGLFPITRTVAFRRFDLGACDVDQEVQAFLDEHLNHDHSRSDVRFPVKVEVNETTAEKDLAN